MSVLSSFFSAGILAQVVRTTIPYFLAASGGIASERSGVVNIALEGMMLVGGCVGIAAELGSSSPYVGLLAAAAIGALIGLLHGVSVAVLRVNGVISGLAINLAALGGTRVLLRTLYRSTSNSPRTSGFHFFEGGDAFHTMGRALAHPTTFLAIGTLVALPYFFTRTTFGLSLRATGDEPTAARALGVPVRTTRVFAAMLGGALAALGGASLAFDQHQFQSGMTSGHGFLALAIVILSNWNVRRAAIYSLLFAALDTLQTIFQSSGQLLSDGLTALPFLVALGALATTLSSGRGRIEPPRGLSRYET